MDISGKTIWQQAAGDTDRNYSDLCLKWDVILNGPGHVGPWPAVDPKCSARKVTDLKRFAEEMKDGDLVVLRIGTSTVLGVGQIVGLYEWCDMFGDVDGWRLQHVRRVRWLWQGESPLLDAYAVKLGDTTQRLNPGAVTEWLAKLAIPDNALSPSLAVLPNSSEQNEISVDDISEFLFDHGVASASITTLFNEIGELKWPILSCPCCAPSGGRRSEWLSSGIMWMWRYSTNYLEGINSFGLLWKPRRWITQALRPCPRQCRTQKARVDASV